MPTIKVDRKEFCELLGQDVPMDVIEERMPMLGTAWEGKGGDVFEVEIFPNRPDMLSVEGLARAFSTFVGISSGLRNYEAKHSDFLVAVDEKVKGIRPYLVSAVVRGVDMSDEKVKSIMQMVEKLEVTHSRKRKKAATGLYDLIKLRFPLTYTTKGPDFKYLPLEQEREFSLYEILQELPKGKDYAWIVEGLKEYPIILDLNNEVLAMIPILNSEKNKVTQATRDLFIEVTGTDWKTINEILNIIVTSFADRGCTIQKVKVKYGNNIEETPNLKPRIMEVDVNYVNKYLGLQLVKKDVKVLLERMGMDVQEIGNKLTVLVPCYRTDVMHMIDLVEDVAIAYGYENFKEEIPNISTIAGEQPLEVLSTNIRSLMVGYGMQETMTFMLSNREKLFGRMNMKEEPVAETSNAKTSEYCVVRNWLLPSLMEVFSKNKHNDYPQKLFEVNDVFEIDESTESGVKTMKRLAIAVSHSRASFSEVRSLFESVLSNFGITGYKVEESKCPCYIKGRAAKFTIDGKAIARFGEISPQVLEKWDLEMPTAGGEICVNSMMGLLKN
jgi:phenylalanyl-tRNA synthetase beta chain